jgi:multicomponent Na+:H+ antiporter subunit C
LIYLVLAIVVGILFATGAYLLLRRDAIKLVLGLSLLSYGLNFMLFGTGRLTRGLPPIVADKETFSGEISQFVDPLPQALILTAIVIGFGVTAFVVLLLNRRNALVELHDTEEPGPSITQINDPFADDGFYLTGLDSDPDDYEWLETPQKIVGKGIIDRSSTKDDGVVPAADALQSERQG